MMRAAKTLEQRIKTRIDRKGDAVFLTREFTDLGGERQVLRALRKLVDGGKLIRLGYGVYARAEISPLTKEPMLAADGFGPAARQALTKLGVRWEPSAAERAYNEGRSTQIPVKPMVRLRGRFARKLRYKSMELAFEQ
ncbi:MAG TPA: hypothetical protein VEI03_22070 [Stellaceae bacterium]|nr:hypothetical protein [Stellaceae bacterium]